jgi:hypothetical protein
MDERVKKLIERFDMYVKIFDQKKPFTGPSVYFHKKTLEVRQQHNTLNDALQDDLFFDYLYATLTAWGLHRMGSKTTRLAEIEDIKASFEKQKEQIQYLQSFEIDNIPASEVNFVTTKLWDVLNNLQIGVGETKIVAGSKALHHLLPNLMPPIDGEYTLTFFYNNRGTALNQGDKTAFKEIYPHFRHVASDCREQILKHVGHGMNTSKTKVVDNAIVGFVIQELLKKR